MKTILLLLLTCLPLCAATTYPMLSTTTSRTVTGGATNLATLNGTNVFTGTNTFVAAGLFPANNIGMRYLNSNITNTYIASAFVSATGSDLTNNGDFSKSTYLAQFTIPPLLGSNSTLAFSVPVSKTNANSSSIFLCFYVGTNTNYIGYLTYSGTGFGSLAVVPTPLLGSFNSWVLQAASSSLNPFRAATNYMDTSVTNTLYVGAFTTTSNTNTLFGPFKAYEIYAP